MNFTEIATELKSNIQDGKYKETRVLLEPYRSLKEIAFIEDEFMLLCDRHIDPINYAIECGKEKIAVYLVEKAFSLHYKYWGDKIVCDKWCLKNHDPDNCPRQLDCCKNAEKSRMEALTLRIDAIKQGKKRPGEGISEPYIDRHMPHTPPPRQNRPRLEKDDPNTFQVSEKKEKTCADEIDEVIEKYGTKYASKNGGSLLHAYVDKPSVYTYNLANRGVPVNVQDANCDTALHLAVRKGKLDTIQALVQCGANLSLRNKMGQTPTDEAEEPIKTYLRKFDEGLMYAVTKSDSRLLLKFKSFWCNVAAICKLDAVQAVQKSDYNKLLRVHKRNWCNAHKCRVKNDKTLLEFTQENTETPSSKEERDAAKNSYRVLSNYKPTSELIHAVLCEDVTRAKNVLCENKDLTVNVRFRDHLGKTLLSHAIEVNNFDLVKLLVYNGAYVAQIRVREHEQSDVTVPLFQKALRRDLDVNIVKFLQTVLSDNREHEEKDVNGNTPLLRAIEEDVDSQTVHWLIKVRGGYSLLDRNREGLTAREIAENRGRTSVVKVIDRFILNELPAIVLQLFPVAFYPKELLNIADDMKAESESGDSLEQKMNKAAEDHNVKTWIDVDKTQNHAISLFTAAANGLTKEIKQLNDANYQDKNGYTALIRAIVFNQFNAADLLCIERPALRRMADNCNRYPLHYAYALPEAQGRPFIRLILQNDASEIESRVDKDGRVAAVYKDHRGDKEIAHMLYDARTLDLFGKRGRPLGSWPEGASTYPPSTNDEEPQFVQQRRV